MVDLGESPGPMVIAIDGPAGAGKSTVARELARELGFTYLNSGAMYRCVALAALERGGGELPEGGGALAGLAGPSCWTVATSARRFARLRSPRPPPSSQPTPPCAPRWCSSSAG